jgi:SAM-dependent methyltransferase
MPTDSIRRFPVIVLVALCTCVTPLAWTPVQQATRPPDMYFAATRQVVVDQMLQLAGVHDDDLVIDLGSGDGRIVIHAAQKYGARGVGIEIDGGLVARAEAIAREGGVSNRVRFIHGDLFEADFSGADVVTLYLSASLNSDLEPKLRQLRPGTRIVSHQFPIGRWAPNRVVRAADGTDLYLWTIE